MNSNTIGIMPVVHQLTQGEASPALLDLPVPTWDDQGPTECVQVPIDPSVSAVVAVVSRDPSVPAGAYVTGMNATAIIDLVEDQHAIGKPTLDMLPDLDGDTDILREVMQGPVTRPNMIGLAKDMLDYPLECLEDRVQYGMCADDFITHQGEYATLMYIARSLLRIRTKQSTLPWASTPTVFLHLEADRTPEQQRRFLKGLHCLTTWLTYQVAIVPIQNPTLLDTNITTVACTGGKWGQVTITPLSYAQIETVAVSMAAHRWSWE